MRSLLPYRLFGPWLALVLASAVQAQPSLPDVVAATVNGQPISELAVQRALKSVPPEHRARAREEILDFLIDLVLLDQHVIEHGVQVSAAEVDAQLQKVKEEAAQMGRDYEALLKQLLITEAELKQQLAAELRWQKYLAKRVQDAHLAEFFAARKEWFDGTQVRARHILVAVEADASPADRQAAQRKAADIRKRIEEQIAQRVAQVDGKKDPVALQEIRLRIASDVFADAARDSDCPSKKNGGDLGWFARLGSMVEPFAQAAFSLQPGDITGPVQTQFDYHIILCTGRMPGKAVSFDQVKDLVREVYAAKLRQDLLPGLRKQARIERASASKP
jgi:peptidyl-prolyl cis-trans isomerase C